jgi:Fe-S cluster assembly protein SufD
MSEFIAQAAKLAQSNVASGSNPSWIADLNQDGLSRWHAHSLPTRKTENWKYTSLKALESKNYLSVAEPKLAPPPSELADLCHIPDLDGIKVVFVNGYFSADLSHASFSGGEPLFGDTPVTVTPFSKANDEQKAQIAKNLDTVVETDKHMFSSLNASCLSEGVYVHVGKNQQLKQPIHIVSITTAQQTPFMVNQRALICLDEGSEASVVEHFVSTEESQNSFVNNITEVRIGDNAKLQHYRLHEEEESAIHIGGLHVELNRSATIDSFHLASGGQIKRIDIVVHHRGEGAHSELNGVYLPRNKQHVDYHTCIEHAVPNCTSNEVFRGIVSDSARAVFNGRIHIHRDAQKTYAKLSNKNLLTSNKAEVDTKPELEIYADDVQCAHGATVAQLDTESLHYFRTRGISSEVATVMLSFGFINELINNVKSEPVGNYLRPKLTELFTVSPDLARHGL